MAEEEISRLVFGVESYQISGALHLGLGVLEDGGGTQETKSNQAKNI